jgi:hypothetical protein
MKYTYYPEFDADDCLEWHVYETATDQVVVSFLFEEDAVLETNRLERGGAFDGFTPSFMLTKVPTDINDKFSAEFAE